MLPLSIVGEIVLKLSTRTGHTQIWPHKIQLGQNWLQALLQEGVEHQSTRVIAEAPLKLASDHWAKFVFEIVPIDSSAKAFSSEAGSFTCHLERS